MGEMISLLIGLFILAKGVFWMKMGRTGDKTNYLFGVMAIAVGILMLGFTLLSFR